MTGTLYNGIYGYGTYGVAQYGIGGITFTDEVITMTDVITILSGKLINLTSSNVLTDVLIVSKSKPEPTYMFINGSNNSGIPKIEYVSNIISDIRLMLGSTPVIRGSTPYGYGT